MTTGGGAAAAAAAAAIANAIKASGVLVRLEASEFERLLERADEALVVYSPPRSGWFGKHEYLVAWRGFAFYTKRSEALPLGGRDVVVARSIFVPS
jgi:hypothetical protein